MVFATHNNNKLVEIQNLLGNKIELLSLNDIGCLEEIPETANTLEGNAFLKSNYIFEKYGKNCFADDTGLEVEALNGAPGVLSARYAGEAKSSEDNMNKLLLQLQGISNRKARFRTIISLIINGKETLFDGIVKGTIAQEKSGAKGFGYDPIFIPDGYNLTFAEMGLEQKNKISHRAIAVKKLVSYLSDLA